MSSYDMRSFANEIYFELPNDLRWYSRRGGSSKETLHALLDAWIRMMAPITPHFAEEMWERIGGKGLVSSARFPEPKIEWRNHAARAGEDYLGKVSEDIGEILKVTGIAPKRIVLTVSPGWKQEVLRIGLELVGQGKKDVGDLIKRSLSIPGADRQEVPKFAKQLMSELSKSGEEELTELATRIDEYKTLDSAKSFLAKEFSAEILVQRADEKEKYDPAGKARGARPRKPSILVE